VDGLADTWNPSQVRDNGSVLWVGELQEVEVLGEDVMARTNSASVHPSGVHGRWLGRKLVLGGLPKENEYRWTCISGRIGRAFNVFGLRRRRACVLVQTRRAGGRRLRPRGGAVVAREG
jgi:hypothetical protein